MDEISQGHHRKGPERQDWILMILAVGSESKATVNCLSSYSEFPGVTSYKNVSYPINTSKIF